MAWTTTLPNMVTWTMVTWTPATRRQFVTGQLTISILIELSKDGVQIINVEVAILIAINAFEHTLLHLEHPLFAQCLPIRRVFTLIAGTVEARLSASRSSTKPRSATPRPATPRPRVIRPEVSGINDAVTIRICGQQERFPLPDRDGTVAIGIGTTHQARPHRSAPHPFVAQARSVGDLVFGQDAITIAVEARKMAGTLVELFTANGAVLVGVEVGTQAGPSVGSRFRYWLFLS